MVPSYFVQLEQMPLSPNGKIDRKALPAPEGSLQSGADYVAPRTWVEAKLAQIWQDVLGLAQVGVKENFFEIGGHSLRATTLASKIHKELNKPLPLRSIFEAPTIEQLAAVLESLDQVAYASIPVTEKRSFYPLSSAQKRLYVLHQFDPHDVNYNMPSVLHVSGPLDVKRVEDVFGQLIARHATLRTRFALVDGEPMQWIEDTVPFAVEHTKVQAGDTTAQTDMTTDTMVSPETQEQVQRFVRPFDLQTAPLLRVGVVDLGVLGVGQKAHYLLMLDMHHIVSDGVSMQVLTDEFVRLYGGEELSPLRIQYKDYAAWQQSETHQEWMQRQEAYWLNTFRGELPVLDLPTDFARPAVQSTAGDTIEFGLEREVTEHLKELAAQTGSTLYMVLLAAYTALLHKYTGQEDIVVGTPIAGRPHAELESLVGVFINTLAIRNYPSGDKTFLDYLQEVKEHALSAYEHQDYPFEELVEKLNLTRDTSRNALFDTMFELKTLEQQEFQLEGLTLSSYPLENNTAKFDLTLDALEQPEGILCSLEYSTALYKPETIARFAKHFTEIVRAIAHHPQQQLAALNMVTAEEKAQILYGFGDVGVPDVAAVEAGVLFHAFVEEQAQLVPDHVAVVYEQQQLTYRTLNERANQLARRLRKEGIERESIVGILSERSVDMLVGVLAVWKAGGAYVPLDADYPSERIRFMLEDSGATVLLTQIGLQERAQVWLEESRAASESATGLHLHTVLALDDESLYTGDVTDIEHINEPQDLAYVIYTSGTTGRPKGVMIEHHSLVNTAVAYRRDYRLSQFPVRLLQLASFSFDVFVGDIARVLYNGGTMVICPKDDRIDPSRLYGWIHDYQITVFESTPALIVPFMQHVHEHGLDMSSLELLITSSDSCSVTDYRMLQERFGADIRIINSYGVTEAAIDSSFYDEELSKLPGSGNVPIGQAWLNARFYIVDSQLNPVPIGVLGELYIGGAGVARGYLNRAELTAEKFMANPYVPGERLYRTGDLARWMPDGNVDFIGRMDYQVKIRGFRIELGEVEAQLLTVEGIQKAIVTAWETEDGNKDLCAYIVASAALNLPELRNTLQPKLPGYMIPAYVVQLDHFPLTPNGKIDRKALPAPEARLEGGTEYVAPRTLLEEQLVLIWQSVLNHPQIGIKDNFFEVGGHSLRATTLMAKIHQELNHKLALRDIFQYPTIEQLVQVMGGHQTQQTYASIPVVEERAYYPVSSAQKRMYVLSHLEGGEVSYNMPGALIIEGSLDKTKFEEAFRLLIARHETLRTSFDMLDGEVVQRIAATVEFNVEHAQASEEETQQYALNFVRAFDLAQAPLLRVQLVENGPQRHVMLYDMHHIISDGVTDGIIVQEFSQLYEGKELPPLRIQYKDYAVWQHSDMHSDRLRDQESYWLKTMAGEIPALDMPTDFARPAVQRLEGARYDFAIGAEDSEQLKQLAAQTGSTLYMVLLAAYSTLLHKYTGQDDIIVGTPIAGRPHAELESLVGVFLNTLAIRNYPSGDKTFLDYLLEVKEHALSAYEHQDYPFEELVEKLNLTRDTSRNALFDTMFELKTFEQQEFELEGLTFKPYPTENNTAKFDLTLDAVEQPEGILCSLEYSTALYKPETIARLAKHFTELVHAIILHPQQSLAALDMVTAGEKAQILYGFGDVGVSDVAAVEAGALFHAFVEEQAQLVPDHVAVVYEQQQLTYRTLNERANQLARRLRKEGIERESIVGILSKRSVDMLVGVLAVWKAGGAYVPLDADYPSERIRFMLEDSGATVLLTQTDLQERAQVWVEESQWALAGAKSEGQLETAASAETLEQDAYTLSGDLSLTPASPTDRETASEPAAGLRLHTVLALDDESLYTGDTTDIEHINEPQDLAYVIYTSGTTGRPKGVMIEHHSLVNTAVAYRRDYRLSQFPVRLLQLASFSFDVFVGDIARVLFNGGTMVICPKDDRIDPSRLYGWIRDYQITVFESTPALIVPFMQHVHEHGLDMSSLELLITSSDSCSVTDYRVLQERFGADIRIINSYGVTEAAIDSSFYDEELSKLPGSGNVPIGQAWLNARFYIVDSQLNPVPIGVLGELCIGGAGVARGYLNRTELTAEKFVANPYVPGERLYRTGDLARWMPDGNVDFIGRMDYQVKIRGFRIELGEIETAIQRVPGVRQAVVIDRTDERGHKYLCGYLTGEAELRLEEVQAELEAGLPAHMVPARLMRLKAIPLTSNGKIDRKALPEPEGSIHTGAAYVAPRTTVEQVLATVWAGVLSVEAVGTQDNFFELGGDSIKALQVSSRLLQAGYRLEMKDLFSNPTLSTLALRVQSVTRLADQSEVAGAVKLTPVQQWFFEQNLTDAHHHNQSIMLHSKDGFDEPALRMAMDQIVSHHDALRTIFRPTDHGYEAWNRLIGEGELYTLERMDFRNETELSAAIEAKVNEIQAGIHLSEGPLMKLGLFNCPDGDHLLIVIHHLVVDGVSWRILFEDITTAYEQALNGQAIRLPLKTDSFRIWADEQSRYANGPAVAAELAFWQEIEQGVYEPLPKDQPQPYSLNKDSEIITATWTAQETEQLLKQAHRAYNTDMNDLLLTALGMAVHRWAGIERVLVSLEGHGRESILPELDITRTVGWFTTQFPVVLDMGVGQDLSRRIKNVKEGLRRIPQKGIGYGILRYLSAAHAQKRFVTEPEISFNYLGQFDQDLQNQSIDVSPYSSGTELSAHAARSHTLDMNGLISEGELQLTISYSNQEYRRETMEQLAEVFRTSLQEIIAHCVGRKQQELTPSDVMLKNVTMAELDQLVERTRSIGELENVYALTPMQKGMLFHSLMDAESGAYFEQTTFDLHGRFQVDVFQDSLNHLAQRHEIFRANFISGWQDEPVQVIFRHKDVGFTYEDLCHLDDQERDAYVKDFIRQDKATGFDLSRDALMRVAILRTGDEDYYFVWSSHHILMDGWCVALVTDEVFEAYFAAVEHREPKLAPVTPYSQYIEWLEAQDVEAASSYWNDYLLDYDQQTSIPTGKAGVKADGAQFEHVLCDLGKDLTGRIEMVAKQHHVTTNTLLQTAWGLLLQKYNSSDDAVFGGVVSGRPADIPGIENMVGLFINTIPVRIRSGAEETFADMIRANQKQALVSQVYETYPLYEIQALTEQKQDLINHIIVFENYPVEEQVEQLGEGAESDFKISNAGMIEQTNYDFNVLVMPQEAMKIRFEYNAKLYDREAVERTQGHLVQLLEQVTAKPDMRVHELDVLGEQECEQILGIWGNTAAAYPSEQTIHGLFETQAAQTPEQAALFFEGEQLTYRELNERANRLARTLRNQGVTKDSLVGLMAERSVELIVGILGILKAGGAYVPIDPTYPEERIRYMLNDSGAELLLTQSYLVEKAVFDGHVLVLDGAQTVDHEEGSNLEPLSGPNDLAYVIYTSGTTGQPKGVMVEHRNVVRLVKNTNYAQLDADTRILQTGAVVFDASTFEIWGALLNGGQLVLVNQDVILDALKLKEAVRNHGITTMWLTAPLFNQLSQQDLELFEGIRELLVGGDVLSVPHINRVMKAHPHLQIINGYGPTENTTFSTTHAITGMQSGSVPIGRPIHNSTAYVVDRSMRLQPVGVWGELIVGGDGVARGYRNRPDLTAEKFIDSPFRSGESCYRTGDLVRLNVDGTLEYKGRIDAQVKIRGYRIELGEVEMQLLKLEAVREAMVIAREDEQGQKQLCAYVVADEEVVASELRSALSQELPGYMVPSYFIHLEQMPLTPNGKIDRKALPAPEVSLQSEADYVEPRTWVEAKLAQIWQEVLGLTQVGVKENFFEIGGHSLRATTLASKIHKELNKLLPLRSIFEAPTIEQLAAVLESLDQVTYASIPVTEACAFYPLSSAQKRQYVLHQFDPNDVNYNIPSVLQVSGPLDVKRVENVFRQLLARHATLRTRFTLVDSEPMQWIEDTVPFEVEYTKVQAEGATTAPHSDTDTMISKEAQELVRRFVRPFSLQAAPLLRVGVVDLGVPGVEQEAQHLLMLDMHHIVSDGVSMGVLTDEFVRLYGGEELSPLRIQYKDYAVWQQSEAHQEWMQRQEAYWLDTFRGELPVLDLPTDFARPAVRNTAGDTVVFGLEREVNERLKELAAQTGSTLYMVLLAAYTALLHQYSGQEDIVVGTPIAGRPHADLEPIIGMFVGTLAMRNYPTAEHTFRSYVEEVKVRALQAYEHQDYPFEELVEKLNVKRDMSRNPLFDTMFTLQTTEEGELQLADLSFRPYGLEQTPAKFDLTLEASQEEAGIQFGLQYATALYQRETVERMTGHFIRLAEAVASNPDVKLGEIKLITAEETERILKVFNDPNAHSVRGARHGQAQARSLSERFEEQAKLSPERVAVVSGDTALTYTELNEQANQLARVLRAKGVEADQPVGVLLERSADILVSILGILKAGGAYVPMDTMYPQERIDYMLQDSGATVVITSKVAILSLSLPSTVRAIVLDDEDVQAGLDGQDASNLIPVAGAQNLAYMIYTSGTTGQPKGVMIEQGSVSNLVDALFERVYSRYEQPLHVAWLSAFVFDASVKQIFASLLLGHTLHVVSRDVSLSGEHLIAYYRTHRIDLSDGTPAHLHILNESVSVTEAPDVKHYLIGGEALSVQLVNVFLHKWSGYRPVITNVYGPTETTVDATAYTIEDVEALNVLLEKGEHTVSIGTPIANQSVYILNSQQQLVPIGIAGELYIGGAGVGRGYLNLPELTAEKFIPNPFVSASLETEQAQDVHIHRMYRTGDLARWLPDGSIEYLGRIDHQVKIRGYRIELGEVEAQLLTVYGIQKAVVTAWENEDGHKDLCAYIVASASLSLPELRSALQPKLPDYMIPTYVVQMDRFPLTPSGKIDRRALPAPEARLEGGMEYVAPRTPLEAKLAHIWQDVLKLSSVGVTDSFFDVGGHSLRATTLVAKIHQELDSRITLREVFQHFTIEQQAKLIATHGTDTYTVIPAVAKQAYYPVSSAQKRLYILSHLSHLEGGDVSYNMPGVLIVEGPLQADQLESAFCQLIARHETLRTSFEMVEGEVVQRVYDQVEFAVERLQASESEAEAYIGSFVRSFDLRQAPLLRVRLIQTGPERHLLMYDMHHIISDGVSSNNIVQELVQLYEGQELQPLQIQYKDYAAWQQQEMQRESYQRRKHFWLEHLAGELPVLDLPIAYPRPAVRSFEGALYEFTVDPNVSEQLHRMAAQTGSTLYMVLLSAYTVLLSKYSGQDDLIIGTPVAGRLLPELEPLIGMFVNTLAIRHQLRGNQTFYSYLLEARDRTLQAFEHQDYPLEELVEKLDVARDASRNPLFDTMFVLENTESQEAKLETLSFSPYVQEHRISKFDLTLSMSDEDGGIKGSFEYCTKLFGADAIERLTEDLLAILSQVGTDPDLLLSDIQVNSGEQPQGFSPDSIDFAF
ncbi:non-ribosomal peptide synthase/polyketide synthase [Paenibacillus peoriae]|nr:non-ribosomal peptide synthase/polyketide synthase [Paenibacillus peoriae]MEC0182798.1 non-ribosomal peptide synthase/polyketide synthase [Paenibacillus peoriae]